MTLTFARENPIDRTDPNYVGLTTDELVATIEGISLRRIRYTHPATGMRMSSSPANLGGRPA